MESSEAATWAADQVAESEREVDAVVEWWRTITVPVPPPEHYKALLLQKPYTEVDAPDLPAWPEPYEPPTIDLAAAMERTRAEVEAHLSTKHRPGIGDRAVWLAVGAGIGGVAAAAFAAVTGGVSWLALIAGLPGVAFVPYLGHWRWRRRLEPRITSAFAELWPEVEADLRQKHAASVQDALDAHATELKAVDDQRRRITAEHNAANAAARVRWEQDESRRTERLRRLMAGEPAIVGTTLQGVLDRLDFPFETNIDYAVPANARLVRLVLSLPELEDVIPEYMLKALRSGALKEIKRPRDYRNLQYAELALGLGFALANVVHACLPSIELVTVAGRARRSRRGSPSTQEQYFVYELHVDKPTASRTHNTELAAIQLAPGVPGRIDLGVTGVLKKVAAPSWLHEVDE